MLKEREKVLKEKDVNIFFINNDDINKFKTILSTDFIEICWGKNNTDLFNVQDAYDEFLARIKKRDDSFKMGFIGEFINHLFFKYFDKFKPISIFFSEGDRANKRGFDLFHFDGNDVWYTEVKSGAAKEKTNEFNVSKIKEGFTDVSKKFSIENRNKNHWNYAKIQMALMSDKSSRLIIKEILEKNYDDMNVDSIILSTVIFGDNDDEINNVEELQGMLAEYSKKFKKVTFLCMRQKTFAEIMRMLEELNNNEK